MSYRGKKKAIINDNYLVNNHKSLKMYSNERVVKTYK